MQSSDLTEMLGSSVSHLLAQVQITTSCELLRQAAYPEDQRQLAKTLDVPTDEVAGWVRQADLLRLSDMTPAVVRLLGACQMTSSADIADALPARLHTHMKVVNDRDHVVEHLPSYGQLLIWSLEAQALQRQ